VSRPHSTWLLALVVVALVLVPWEAAGAATTRLDAQGTIRLDGRKVFPIVLAKGPERGSTTPTGAGALAEVAAAGVNVLKIGPGAGTWTGADIVDAIAWNREAAAHGLYTWVNLATLSRARPNSWRAALLRKVIGSLERDPSARALALWKGADEPWRYRTTVPSLRFAYCLATSRGDPSWCEGKRPADSDHLWVTVQPARGSGPVLARYSRVTDIHGVNHYPVSLGNPDPNLHEVGRWTDILAWATPSQSVWTTLGICWRWSYDAFGNFALPTRREQRYMIYDAIVNGARGLAFYGGNLPQCWNSSDAKHRWSWTYWESVLEPLVREIGALSPLGPALLNPATTVVLPTSDPTVQAIARRGAGGDLWVIAARSGEGTQPVTIGGLPVTAATGEVYTENRLVAGAGGLLTDAFGRWDVHVYRFGDQPA
jgi:hypothetical protein